MDNKQYSYLKRDISFMQRDISITDHDKTLDISPLRFKKDVIKRPASSFQLKSTKSKQGSNPIRNLKKLNVNVNVNVNNQDKYIKISKFFNLSSEILPQINSSTAGNASINSITPINSKPNLKNLNQCINMDKSFNKKIFSQGKLKIIKNKPQTSDKDKDSNSLTEDNIKLRAANNKLQADLNHYRNEFVKSQTELKRREKFFEDLLSNEKNEELFHGIGININDIANSSCNSTFYTNWKNQTKEYFLIKTIRRKFKEKQKELKLKEEEIENLKKSLKHTHINEISIENLTLSEEIQKMKNLYEKLLIEASTNMNYHKDIEILHASLTNQYKVIESTQQHVEELREENNQKTLKIKDIKEKCKNLKREIEIEKMKFKSEKEKIYEKCNNEKDSEIVTALKIKLESVDSMYKMKEIALKELEERYAKEVENKLKVIDEMKKCLNNMNLMKSELSKNLKVIGEKDKEINLIKNQLELEKEKVKVLVKENSDRLNNIRIENIDSYSIVKTRTLEKESNKDIIYINSDFDIKKEFNMILILISVILQINKINSTQLIENLFDDTNEENMKVSIPLRLVEILNLKDSEDIQIIKYFISHIINDIQSESLLSIKEKFSNLFHPVIISSDEELHDYNNKLKNILLPQHLKLYKEFLNKDKNLKGHLTFKETKEIIDSLEIPLDDKLIQHAAYIMKMKNNNSLYEMNYLNLLHLLNDADIAIHSVEETKQKSYDIASTQFLTLTSDNDTRIKAIFKKIASYLFTTNTSIYNLFKDSFVILDKHESYTAIYLKEFLKILYKELHIDQEQTDSIYLLNKLKHHNNQFNAEVIDLDLLKDELKIYEINHEKDNNNSVDSYNSNANNDSCNKNKRNKSKENILRDGNLTNRLLNSSNIDNNSDRIQTYSNYTESSRSHASLLILNENKKCRDILACFSDDDNLDKKKTCSKIIIDEVFTKVLKEIHSRNYEVKIKSQENSLKDDNNGLAIHEGF